MDKLEKHTAVTLGTQHGPTSWSALWAFPAPPGGKPTRLPILMEVPDMIDEEIDVQEACDAGLVDREDLVDELSEYAAILRYSVLLHDLFICSIAECHGHIACWSAMILQYCQAECGDS